MIGVWVCCGDRRWAVGLQWVLFGFAVFGCGVERVVLMVLVVHSVAVVGMW